MQNITGFSKGSFPVRYLGTPLAHGKTKVCYFDHLIDRITAFISFGIQILYPMPADWS